MIFSIITLLVFLIDSKKFILIFIGIAYERGHQRPALTVYTFHAPDGCHSQPSSPGGHAEPVASPPQTMVPKPPIPQRCSSLERPSVPVKIGISVYNTESQAQPVEAGNVCILVRS